MAHWRPGTEDKFEDHAEQDYENVIAPHLLRCPQPVPQPKVEATPDVSLPTFTDHTVCCCRRASIILYVLYGLVCATLLIATAALVLAIWKFIPKCQDNWQQFQTKCYFFSTKAGSWTLANNICDSLGAQLVVTNESNTKEQMVSMLLQSGLSLAFASHIGARNQNFTYTLMGYGLSMMDQERDLGMLVDRSMKVSTHCAAAVKKANSMLGIIKKGIENKTANIIMPLYKSMDFLTNGNKFRYWIGLQWYSKEWKWVDGKSQPNTSWIKGTEKCAYITGLSKRVLQTQSCSYYSRYICEK